MVVSLTWIRDNFDANKNRYIDADEADNAKAAWQEGRIDNAQFGAVIDAYDDHTRLPAYGTTATITCTGPTPHFTSGCALLKHYDSDGSGKLDISEFGEALTDKGDGVITSDEMDFVERAYDDVNINALCPGCHSTTAPPPGSENKPITLEEGKSYPIQISLAGYDTVTATIRISASGVSCTAGPCRTTGLPRVDASGWTVSVHLKKKAATSNGRCAWISGKDSSRVAFISEMVLAYTGVQPDIGFVPSASEIGEAVLMYTLHKTPSELWGC